MDYEKKYNDALEKARKYRDNAKAVKEYSAATRYENIFPELRESEDERMMKNIRLALLSVEDAFWRTHGLTSKEAISYIEKQREQNVSRLHPEDYPMTPEECIKPTEWSENDEKMIWDIVDVLEADNVEDKKKFPYALSLHERYKKMVDWLKSLRPQPKQEVTDEEIEEMVTKRSRSSGTTKSEMAFYRNGIKDAIKRFGLRHS